MEIGLFAWLAVALAAILLLLPGILFSWVAKLRWPVALLSAPLISLSVIGVSPVVAPYLGLRWGMGTYLVGTLVAAALGLFLRYVITAGDDNEQWHGNPWWLISGVLGGGGVFAYRFLTEIPGWTGFSSNYDDPFHLNLVWSILDRGNGSSFAVDMFAAENPSGFYPAAWHDLVALVVETLDIPITVAANATTVSIGGLLWPMAIGLLAGTIFRSFHWAAITALLANAIAQTPAVMVWYGPLYPTILSAIMVPLVLGLIYWALLPAVRLKKDVIRTIVIVLLAVPGIGLAQASTLFGILYLSFPIVLTAVIRRYRLRAKAVGSSQKRAVYGAVIATTVGYFFVDLLTYLYAGIRNFRAGPTAINDPGGNLLQGFTNSILMEGGLPGPQAFPLLSKQSFTGLIILALIFLGCWTALKKAHTRWIPGSFAIALLLFFVAYSRSSTRIRMYMVGVWYGANYRLMMLAGIIAVLLLAIGIVTIALWVSRFVVRVPSVVAVAVVAVAVLLISQTTRPMDLSYRDIGTTFSYDPVEESEGRLLSQDELALLSRLEQHVEKDAWVTGNPWNGSVLTPALGNRHFTFPHVSRPPSNDALYLAKNLRWARYHPEVCQIVNEDNIRYVLDFGEDYLWNGTDGERRHLQFYGLQELDKEGIAEVIDSEGQARLLRITACD